jgi:hypothetical protein
MSQQQDINNDCDYCGDVFGPRRAALSAPSGFSEVAAKVCLVTRMQRYRDTKTAPFWMVDKAANPDDTIQTFQTASAFSGVRYLNELIKSHTEGCSSCGVISQSVVQFLATHHPDIADLPDIVIKTSPQPCSGTSLELCISSASKIEEYALYIELFTEQGS